MSDDYELQNVTTHRLRELLQHEKDNGKLRLDLARCRYALGESVKLQSHYAQLLNMHDGGERIGFTDADEWIARLDGRGARV